MFSAENITPENARIDHLAIYFPKIALQYIDDSEATHLTDYKVRLKNSQLFNSNILGVQPLHFSNHYILGGGNVFSKSTVKKNGFCLTALPLRLQFNPTRFYANLTPEILASIESADEHDLLTKNKPYLDELRDYALDAKNNYLTREAWEASQDFEPSLMRYLNAAREVVTHCFGGLDYQSVIEHEAVNASSNRNSRNSLLNKYGFLRVSNIADSTPTEPILNWSKWQIYRTEIYWDFYHESAPEFVKSIGSQALLQTKRFFAYSRKFRLEDESEQTRFMNAQILSIELKENVKLVIYAKTPTRVRFEVRYLHDRLNDLISIPSDAGIDTRIFSHIPIMLRYAIEDATKRFNRFAATIRFDEPSYRLKVTPSQMVKFFSSLHDACEGSHVLMNTLLTTLCNVGSVTSTRGTELHKAICALRSDSILVATGGQREVYKVAPEYEAILSDMVEQRIRYRAAPHKRKR